MTGNKHSGCGGTISGRKNENTNSITITLYPKFLTLNADYVLNKNPLTQENAP
jgi:hypothetical protein